jgi:hypothetical protein
MILPLFFLNILRLKSWIIIYVITGEVTSYKRTLFILPVTKKRKFNIMDNEAE